MKVHIVIDMYLQRFDFFSLFKPNSEIIVQIFFFLSRWLRTDWYHSKSYTSLNLRKGEQEIYDHSSPSRQHRGLTYIIKLMIMQCTSIYHKAHAFICDTILSQTWRTIARTRILILSCMSESYSKTVLSFARIKDFTEKFRLNRQV